MGARNPETPENFHTLYTNGLIKARGSYEDKEAKLVFDEIIINAPPQSLKRYLQKKTMHY